MNKADLVNKISEDAEIARAEADRNREIVCKGTAIFVGIYLPNCTIRLLFFQAEALFFSKNGVLHAS